MLIIKVLHLTRTYGNHGGENQLRRLFLEGPGEGVREGLVMIYRDNCESGFRQVAGLEVHTLMPFRLSPRRYLLWELVALGLILPVLWISFALCLLRFRPEIVITHNIQSLMVAWPFAMVLRKEKFAYIHRIVKPARRSNTVLSLFYRPFHVVAGNSCAVAKSLNPLLHKRMARVIPNGISVLDLPGQKVSHGSIVAICIGRLIKRKNVDFILKAVHHASQKNKKIKLIIVGDGPDINQLKELGKDLEFGQHIDFLGHRKDIRDLLLASDIFLHASEAEGMSNAVLEAMEAVLPSVVVDAPGVTECHVPDETAFVVARDPEAMACSIHKLADDPDLRLHMGQAARRRVEQEYSMAANRRRFLDLYQDLASGSTMEM